MNFIRVFFFLLLTTALVQCASDTDKKGAVAKAKTPKMAKGKKPGTAKNTKPAAGAKANAAKKGVANQLNFTPEERKKYAQINQKYLKKGAAFRKANKGKLEAIRKNTQSLNVAKDKEMKAFMKPAQYTKYKKLTQRKKPANK